MYKKLLIVLMFCASATAAFAVEHESGIDTTNAVLKRYQKFDRGLDMPAYAFLKKGVMMAGLKASYSQYSTDDYKFFVIDDINVGGYILRADANFGYTFRNNMMLGVRFGYDRTKINVDGASLGISDVDIDFSGIRQIKHTYTGTFFYRYYMGLAQGQRFAFFTEIQLGLGGSQAKQYTSTDDGVYETSFNLSLGLTPGVVAFVTNNFSLEVTVDLIGFKYRNITQTSNQINHGGLTNSSLNCRISPLSMGIGMALYF